LSGFGSGVLQLLNERGLHLPVKILGYADSFVEHGPQTTLWNNAGIDADGIVRLAIGTSDHGHGHWLDTGGRTRGFVTLRWLDNPQAPDVTVRVLEGKAL
jgi:hypothetical protein